MDIATIQQALQSGHYTITVHAHQQMLDRDITFDDVENAVRFGQVVERDQEAQPYPKILVSGPMELSGDAIHLVFSRPPEEQSIRLVTVYFPEERHWETPTKRRRR